MRITGNKMSKTLTGRSELLTRRAEELENLKLMLSIRKKFSDNITIAKLAEDNAKMCARLALLYKKSANSGIGKK